MFPSTDPFSANIPRLMERQRHSLPRTWVAANSAFDELERLRQEEEEARRVLDEARESGRTDLMAEQDAYGDVIRLRGAAEARVLCAELDLRIAALRFANIEQAQHTAARFEFKYDDGLITIAYGEGDNIAVDATAAEHRNLCIIAQYDGQWEAYHLKKDEL